MVRPKSVHPWPSGYREAVALQEKLRGRLVIGGGPAEVRLVAGADVSYSKGSDTYYAGVVVMAYPGLEVVEEAWASGKPSFPYIPGLLSFREGPITLAAFRKLKHTPDVIMLDGQGVAHPRGFGLASHIGLLLDIHSIGCAKSVLVGEYEEPGRERGAASPLVYKGGTVGMALRTRDNVKPVFVSPGHRVSIGRAVELVLGCGGGYRLPESTRRAHILVNRVRVEQESKALTPAPLPEGEGIRNESRARRHRRADNSLTLLDIYNALYSHYGPQRWWPGDTPFEVMAGAILTQNTNWGNVEKAIANLKAAGALSAKAIHGMPEPELAELIRPSGYYNIKAKRLKAFIAYFIESYGGSVARMKGAGCERLRKEVLAVNGVGPETADSILLYALGCPTFVVDAYTKRIFSRHGFFAEDADYHDVRRFFMDNLPTDVQLYNEYHALIVRLAKDRCLKKAGRCDLCLLVEGKR